jgi:hypothetical protein
MDPCAIPICRMQRYQGNNANINEYPASAYNILCHPIHIINILKGYSYKSVPLQDCRILDYTIISTWKISLPLDKPLGLQILHSLFAVLLFPQTL